MFGRRGAGALYFGRDEPDSTGAIFGLMTLALLVAAGAAIDYARIANMREGLEAAVSSASRAAGQAVRDGEFSDDEIKAIAMSRFDKDVATARHVGTVEGPSVMIDHTSKTITLDAKGTVAMTVSRLGGIHDVTVPVTSTVGFPPGTPMRRILQSARSLAYSGGW
jgi:Flp pilus assembly protein TadG